MRLLSETHRVLLAHVLFLSYDHLAATDRPSTYTYGFSKCLVLVRRVFIQIFISHKFARFMARAAQQHKQAKWKFHLKLIWHLSNMISYVLMICDENFVFVLNIFRRQETWVLRRRCRGTAATLIAVVLFFLPAKMIPIDWQFCLAIEMVAYVEPRSAAKPESSDCAGLIALPSRRATEMTNESLSWSESVGINHSTM